MRDLRTILLGLALAGLATTASASPFDDGAAAYRRGDYGRALADWKPLADRDPIAQANIGVLYMDGRGVPRSNAEALKWFVRSAAAGASLGQNNLGGFYREGKAVPRDYAKAFSLFSAAAAQGNAGAQINLGLMYFFGQGTPVDMSHAFMWFTLAADQGFATATTNRDAAGKRMNGEQIRLAVNMAQNCKNAGYKGCK